MRRPAAPREIPPPLELKCLKVLWKLGEGSVRDVREALEADRLAYTTVMTLLERLAKRNVATRRKQGRYFVYTPTASRDSLRAVAVKDLVNDYFDGSLDELRAYLKGSENPSAQAN
jgi:BlaI family transcriptional regulator, penicillinase repressor